MPTPPNWGPYGPNYGPPVGTPTNPAPSSGGGSAGPGGGGAVAVRTPQAQASASQATVTIATIPVVWQSGKAVNAPAFVMTPGYFMEVTPLSANQGTVYWADSKHAAEKGPREEAPVLSNPRQIDVRNLSKLWVFATHAGDGLRFTIRKLANL